MRLNLVSRIVTILLFTFVVTASAAPNVESALQEMLADLDALLDNRIYEEDRPRIFVFKSSVTKAFASFNSNPLHRDTYYAFFNCYVRFKVSRQFFQFIRTRANAVYIDNLYRNFDFLVEEFGFDDSPYMRIIASNLEQILAAIEFISRSEQVSTTLRKKAADQIPKLALAISVANSGDRPSSFKAASEIYLEIRGIYPDLEAELANTQGLFIYYMEIIGVNEFLRDYVEIENLDEVNLK